MTAERSDYDDSMPEAVEVDWPEPDVSVQDRRRLERARDCLIDAEDELLYVVGRDPSLQPHVDVIVRVLMEVSKRAEGKRP